MFLSNLNEKSLIWYFYTGIALSLLLVFLPETIVSYSRYIVYFIVSVGVLAYNKFSINKKFMIIYISTLVLMLVNLMLVSYKYYVAVEIFSFVSISFLPLYILSTKKVDYLFLMDYWYKIGSFFTILIPIYILLFVTGFLNYSHIADLTSINILIFFINIFSNNKKSKFLWIGLIANFFLSLFFGSRMAFLASLLACICVVLFLTNDTLLQFIVKVLLFGITLFIMWYYLFDFLNLLVSFMESFNIDSRNINLFISQLQEVDSEVILSGREPIYNTAISFIRNRDGVPGGLGVLRSLSDGIFYHAHNIFLDLIVIFGVLGAIIVLIYFLYKWGKLHLHFRIYKNYKYYLFFTFTVYFLIKSLFDAYFITHPFFYFSIGIIIFDNKISKFRNKKIYN